MRGAGLFGLRRDHPDIVAEAAGNGFRHHQAGGVNAVIIGHQNAHDGGIDQRAGFHNAEFPQYSTRPLREGRKIERSETFRGGVRS